MARWLHKRGKTYHYRFELNGREYSGTTKAQDLATAKQVLETVRREIVLGEHGIKKAPSLGAVAQGWIETRGKAVSPAHLRAARQSLEALQPLAKLPLTHLTTGQVDAWRSGYLDGHSAASVNLVLRYLKLWCRWAMSQKLIRELPYDTKPVKAQQRPRAVVGLDKLEDFLAAIDAGHRNGQVPCAIRFAMMLGLREAEVLQARWEWLHGSAFMVGGRTKSRKLRSVPVPQPVWTALGWMLLTKRCGLHPKPTTPLGPEQLPDLGLIFPGATGKPHRQGWLRQALKRGGIEGLSMHRLRATFATLHLRAGTPLKEVQAMMGHQDPRTTLIYQEVSHEEQAARQDALWKKA